jgi:hypothetical protein
VGYQHQDAGGLEMKVLGIDPSNTKHAWAAYDSDAHVVMGHGRDLMGDWPEVVFISRMDAIVVEMVASYGMAAGATLFDTCVEIGRLLIHMRPLHENIRRVTRQRVKLSICGQARAKDANVRQALLDLWGGKEATKKGRPLHGLAADTWAALAVAVAATRPGLEYYVPAAERGAK